MTAYAGMGPIVAMGRLSGINQGTIRENPALAHKQALDILAYLDPLAANGYHENGRWLGDRQTAYLSSQRAALHVLVGNAPTPIVDAQSNLDPVIAELFKDIGVQPTVKTDQGTTGPVVGLGVGAQVVGALLLLRRIS